MALETLSAVRVFVQVVGSNGLAAAARVLGMPANTVSRTISRLESDLGARLFVRTTRSLSLTEEGRTFYGAALSLLAAAEHAESAVAPATEGLSGVVRLAVRTTTVQFELVSDLTELLRAHRALRIQLLVTDDEVDLAARGLDLALRVGALADSSYASRHIGDVTFVLAASPVYLERFGRPGSPAELVAHECVRPLGDRAQTYLRLEGPRRQKVDASVSGRFECNDVRSQASAIYAGLGIGLRPIGEVRRAVKAGTLERVLPGWKLEPLPVRVLQPPRTAGVARTRAVREVIALLGRVVERMA